jgi:hypothetical protein
MIDKNTGNKTISKSFFKDEEFISMRQEYFDSKGKIIGLSSSSIIGTNANGTQNIKTIYYDSTFAA